MEKKVWENPLTMVQQFVPNEYVAACGDGDDKFEPVLTGILGGDRYMGTGYHACGEKHVTQTGDEFIEGWYVTGWDAVTGQGDIAKKVIIWRGPDGNNIHCTTNLDKNTWETAKS